MESLNLDTLSEAKAIELIKKITPRAGEKANEIAKACGYLPLALRLAASALREQANLTVDALLQRLTDAEKRFDTLKEVHAAIQVSYDLLSEDRQTALRQLAVFPADFDQLAAAAVWDADEEAAQERLAALMNASLVDFNAKTGRYKLHDLIHAAAKESMKPKEMFEIGHRFSAHYLQSLSSANDLYMVGGEKILVALSYLDLEWPNIKTGQDWVAEHIKDTSNAQLCARYYNAGANCLPLRLHSRERLHWLENALAAAHKIGDRRGEGAALGNLGLTYAAFGQFQLAIEYHEKCLKIARENDDLICEGTALSNLGSSYDSQGFYDKAIVYHEQALRIFQKINYIRGKSSTLGNMGLTYANLGQHKQAIRFFEQALEFDNEIGDQNGESKTLGNLGIAYASLGQNKYAIDLFQESLKIARKIGSRSSEGAAMDNLGIAYKNLRLYRKSKRYLQQAITIFHEIGNRSYETEAQWDLGEVLEEQGSFQEAIPLLQAYVDYLTEIGHPDAEKRAAHVEELRGNL